MEQFEKILLKHNCPKRLDKSLVSIEEIERFIGFSLPKDYKTYLQTYLGFKSEIGQEYVRLWDIDELKELNTAYEIPDNLLHTLAIGGNGGGEFIAIEYVPQQGYRIVLSPFIDLDDQYHLEIGTSFADFLIRLDNGKTWFRE